MQYQILEMYDDNQQLYSSVEEALAEIARRIDEESIAVENEPETDDLLRVKKTAFYLRPILNYAMARYNQIQEAAQPFISEAMYKASMEFPSETPVWINIECPNGYSKTISLGEWRKLFIAAFKTEGEENED